ncbi:unnamed protein product [Adineta steineri]|uniref:RING-type E3 ubiquitin transferase n=1 Tax=Adineta steineri TaxID=433720 RepID=A0A815HPA0_9BILA|nr:unnamed protein product [Adineta steineri]
MPPTTQILQPYYNEFLRCAICSHDFEYDNYIYRPITLPICGHTMCGQCIDIIRKQTKCPQDQISFGTNIPVDQLPINYPLLFMLYDPSKLPEDDEQRYGQCLSFMKLDDETKSCFHQTQSILSEISLIVKPILTDFKANDFKDCQQILSRPIIRKVFGLLNSQFIDREGRLKALKAARSLGERACIDFIIHHQNPQQLTANLWSAVRSRGCQFLGPAMQEEVLKLILLALEDGSALSRKVLVLFVVQKLAPQYPRASKTSVGHVVQLLYRASCFKVQKREEESSLMQLKSEFRNYENLRREHDSQIIQIAIEAGLRISPEQWSSLLYGDAQHKSSMQSIIDKLSTPASFSQAIQEFLIVLQRAGDSSKHLSHLKTDFEVLSQIDLGNTDQQIITDDQHDHTNWSIVVDALKSIKTVLQLLMEFNWQESKTNHFNKNHYHHRSYDLSSTTFTSSTSCSSPMTVSPLGGSSTTSEYHLQPLHPSASQHNQVKYKVSMCRDFVQKQSCPRGVHCTFAHSKAEMDKYRAKSRHPNGSLLPLTTTNTNASLAAPPSIPTNNLPIYPSTNNVNLIRPIPPSILPMWNPQQQQQQQQHLIQEIPQQHHHHHYYHPSQIPPSILQMHGHPSASSSSTTTTTYEHQQQNSNNSNNTNNNNSSQIPVIAAAAQAILEQNNAAAAALAASAFYRFQQQNSTIPFHQPQSMIGQQQQQQQSLLSRPCLSSTNTNPGQQQSTNSIQQRSHNYTEARFSSLSDQHNSHQSSNHFPHIEDLRLPPVMPLNGNNSTDNTNLNQRNYSVLQTIPSKNDDNLLYFPSINNLNRQQQQQHTYLTGSNNTNGLFNDILPNNNNNNNNNNNTTNPISTLSTNTFMNNRQQPFKSISTMAYPQQQQQQQQQQQHQQQQQLRNDENVFHNNHPHPNNFDDDDYSLINIPNNNGGGGVGGTNSNDSSFFYFGSANAHATAAYNFYHPNSPLGGNGHSLKA